MREKIKQINKDIKNEKKVLDSWKEFESRGHIELDMKIRLLRNELEYMEENYLIISSKDNF
jgi:hypothetical protein